MPRLPRIKVEGAIYYVTARASQNELIFKDKDDYKMYLDLVSKYKSQHKFKLFSYNLLPDHLELLIETGSDLPAARPPDACLPARQGQGQAGSSISEIMHDLNSLYTKYFNGRYQKHGHLFESRFRSVLVEKVNYLVAMTRHIHLTDKDNAYSSFRVYTQNREGVQPAGHLAALNISPEVQEVLSFLKNKDDASAYERYVLEGDKNEIEELEKSLKRAQVLGSDTFHEQVKQTVQEHSELLKEQPARQKVNPVLLYMIGGLVVLATASSIYLYISKNTLENKYRTLLQGKEAEFSEKTRFENQGPLALTELDGTEWEIETVPAPRGGVVKKDRIRFKDGRFESEAMAAKGFRSSSYFLIPQGGRVVLWQAAQSNPAGDTLAWRGTWQGDAMKGALSVTPAGGKPQVLSFFSKEWAYVEAKHDTA